MICVNKPASQADRVMGPRVSKAWDRSAHPNRLISPVVVLRPVMPFREAGIRIEPPVSEPIAAAARPAATATAEPLDEPPGTRWVVISHGFFGVPRKGVVPQVPKAYSTIWVLPNITAPAASSLVTAVAVCVLSLSFHGFEPTVVLRP